MKKILLLLVFVHVWVLSFSQTLDMPFVPMDTQYRATIALTSPEVQLQPLYTQDVNVVKSWGGVTVCPPMHDYMYFIPSVDAPNEKGHLIINHEVSNLLTLNPILGQGGAMSIVPVKKENGKWEVKGEEATKDTSIMIDFRPVGWTMQNCSGGALSNGNHISGEEVFANYEFGGSLSGLININDASVGYDGEDFTIPADYPEFGGKKIPAHFNFGWMVEVNPNTAKAVHKNYHMGRYSHEGGVCMPDKRTVYLTDDFVPAVLFKFVADEEDVFSAGNLFAFKQFPNSEAGEWVAIPRNIDSLIRAREVALNRGATAFIRLEGITSANGKIYFSETGRDNCGFPPNVLRNGDIAFHHYQNPAPTLPNTQIVNDTKVVDHPYGSVLMLDDSDPHRPIVKALLNGGSWGNNHYNLSGPDAIGTVTWGAKSYLMIQEDIIGSDKGRVKANFVGAYPHLVNEAFLLDLSIPSPSLSDLQLFFAGSRNAELAGACTTPDGSTIFINNQHPDPSQNNFPFNRSGTIALTGFGVPVLPVPCPNGTDCLIVYPNPSTHEIKFNHPVTGELITTEGEVLKSFKQIQNLYVEDVATGLYFILTDKNEKVSVFIR